MVARIAFFPVGNGDMTLITLESGRTILIDVNIREVADDPNDKTPDVAKRLRDRLKRDSQGRLYVDVFLLSHPDADHCNGLAKHFHLGPQADWSKNLDKIFVREIWSSPMVFRRASRDHVLCDDALAFSAEARRRVKRFRDTGGFSDGDRILILGEDQDGKTDDLMAILVKVDQVFSRVNGQFDPSLTARLLAPLPKSDDEDEEEILSKNNSSTIIRFSFTGDSVVDACKYLSGGDAEVAIWERLWKRHWFRSEWFEYDILLTPHHCSWHSLSYDSWSELGEYAEVCAGARSALSQTRKGPIIVASSEPIKDDENDPPCIRAKREYEDMAHAANGSFKCVGEHLSERNPDIMEFEIHSGGPSLRKSLLKAAANATGLSFPPRPILPNKPAGFAQWSG
jgi:hypothetical protein